MKKPIGLLGGTFDPVHFGHLRTALELQQALGLAEVRLIPCAEPVHRASPFASPEARLAMVECAIANEPHLRADPREIRRAGPSWTIDTLESLRQELPDTPLCLILGIDAMASLPGWHRFTDIITLAHLVIAHRPHYHMPDNSTLSHLVQQHKSDSPADLHRRLAGSLLFHPVTQLEISSTDIRRQFATGQTPRYLLPDAVCDYIRQHGIYHSYDGNLS